MSAQAEVDRLELADNARIKRSMKPKMGKTRVRLHFNGCALITDNSGSKFWLYNDWLRMFKHCLQNQKVRSAAKPYQSDWVLND